MIAKNHFFNSPQTCLHSLLILIQKTDKDYCASLHSGIWICACVVFGGTASSQKQKWKGKWNFKIKYSCIYCVSINNKTKNFDKFYIQQYTTLQKRFWELKAGILQALISYDVQMLPISVPFQKIKITEKYHFRSSCYEAKLSLEYFWRCPCWEWLVCNVSHDNGSDT